MKYWVSHLPLEVWVDVFRYPWISRREMGQIVDKIGNYKFAQYLQFYLHDWGRRKLKPIYFYHADRSYLVNNIYIHWDIPLEPLPNNIESFQHIQIEYFDAHTIDFLHQIGSILSNVDLELVGISPNHIKNLRIILTNLVPLLNPIHSLACDVHALPTMKQCFGGKFDEIKQLRIFGGGLYEMDAAAVQARADILLNWLTTPGDNSSGPRLCNITYCDALFKKISSAIRQEFFAAKTPCTFALTLRNCSKWWEFADFHHTNTIGEELHGEKMEDGDIQISRHRANCGTELQEWINEIENNTNKNHGLIRIIQPSIGFIIDAMDENGEEVQRKPSTSKEEQPFCSCSLM